MIIVPEFQQITYNDAVVAVVVGGQAIIPKMLAAAERRTVEAMCLYALEVAAGQHPGPYTDERAAQYAHRVAAERAG
jgi:uridylate kinase